MNSILKNFFYQVVFQLTRIVLPIITLPIVARSLEPEGIGLYNYTSSIIQYFIMFSGLGFSLLGSREISIAFSKKENISEKFCEIFYAKAIVTIIMVILFVMMLPFLPNKFLLFLQLTNLIYILFDVSWFFMGIENFKVTSMSNLLGQVIGFIMIILFVKGKDDIYVYVLIQSGSLIIPNIIIWPMLLKYVSLKRVKLKLVFLRIFDSIKYFIPQISNTVLGNINKTFMGIITTNVLVGFYTNSLVINTVFITVIMTMDTVMIPRLSSFFSRSEKEKMLEYFTLNVNVQLFFSVALMFGMLTIVDKLIPWFFGDKFLFIINTIPLLSVLIIVMPLSMTIARQYLLPQGRTKEYNQSMVYAVILTIIMDVILIPRISILGVIITNISVELFLLCVRLYGLRKDKVKLNVFNNLLKYLISGVLMMIITRYFTKNLSASVFTNIIQAVVGFSIYMVVTYFLKVNVIIRFLKKEPFFD